MPRDEFQLDGDNRHSNRSIWGRPLHLAKFHFAPN